VSRPPKAKIVMDMPAVHMDPTPIPVAMRRKWYHPLKAPPADLSGVKVEMIQRAVINHFGLTFPELKSHRRMAKFARPRQIAMYLCRELVNKSLPEIGRLFGGRDHTTVLHAAKRVEPVAWTDRDVVAIRNQILGDMPVPEADPNQPDLGDLTWAETPTF
jgi:chromosomal replication initiation ATPase DnaA